MTLNIYDYGFGFVISNVTFVFRGPVIVRHSELPQPSKLFYFKYVYLLTSSPPPRTFKHTNFEKKKKFLIKFSNLMKI